MKLTQLNLAKVLFVTMTLGITLIPHFLFYKYLAVKYLYLLLVPIFFVKIELNRFKVQKRIFPIDWLVYSFMTFTLFLSVINLSFIEIYVWQITIGVLGVLFDLIF